MLFMERWTDRSRARSLSLTEREAALAFCLLETDPLTLSVRDGEGTNRINAHAHKQPKPWPGRKDNCLFYLVNISEIGSSLGMWSGEVCLCRCIALLPQLACSILATTYQDLSLYL